MKSSDAADAFKISIMLLGPCEVDTTTAAWKAAEREGWDMSLVMDSLRKTVAQRMHEHSMALAQAESLQAAFDHKHVAS